MMDMALSDVRVLDLTQYIAGPYATKLMADYGAEVIKIERPHSGDPARRIGPFFHDDPNLEQSGTFLMLNTNKKSLTLNLKTERGRRIVKDLVRDCDVVIENFAPGVMARLGLSYAELETINPRLVMASVSNFGQWGPYRDLRLSEIVLFGMGGDMYITGFQEREPIKLGLTVILYQMGNMAAAATMGAFYGARHRGIGQHLDFSMMEAEMGTIDRGATNLVAAAYSGEMQFNRPPVDGGGARFILPSGVFPCADGYVFITSFNVGWWPGFCRAIGHPELLDDPRFQTVEALYNLDYKEEMDLLLLEWLLQRTKQEAMEQGQAAGFAVTAINTIDDLFRDPHFRDRGFWADIEHPAVGNLTYPGAPFQLSETPWRAGRAPMLGEHNRDILCGRLGYTAQELVRMRELDII